MLPLALFILDPSGNQFGFLFLGTFMGKSIVSFMLTALAKDFSQGLCLMFKLLQAVSEMCPQFLPSTDGGVCHIRLGDSFNPKNKTCWPGLSSASAVLKTVYLLSNYTRSSPWAESQRRLTCFICYDILKGFLSLDETLNTDYLEVNTVIWENLHYSSRKVLTCCVFFTSIWR